MKATLFYSLISPPAGFQVNVNGIISWSITAFKSTDHVFSWARKLGLTLEISPLAKKYLALHDHENLCGWIFTYAKYHVKCPRCNADLGEPCLTPKGRIPKYPHKDRVDLVPI